MTDRLKHLGHISSFLLLCSTSAVELPVAAYTENDKSRRSATVGILAHSATSQFNRNTTCATVAGSAGSQGVYWADYDGDDFPDLLVTNYGAGDSSNWLFHNNRDGTFTIVADQIVAQESYSGGGSWGDYDNDNDPDLFLANFGFPSIGAYNYLYTNEGDGSFAKVTTGPLAIDSNMSNHAVWEDVECDGDLDLLLPTHSWSGITLGTFLYRNDSGQFARVFDTAIGIQRDGSEAATFGDADGDGDPDLILVQDAGTAFYLNDGDGTFTHQNSTVLEGAMMAFAWGDYDNDGDFDIVGGGFGYPQLLLFNNDGNAQFTSQIIGTIPGGPYSSRPYWADYDNDGDLDLFVGCGQGNRLYQNIGGSFVETINSGVGDAGENSWGAAWADFDRDGDLDLYAAEFGDAQNVFYVNNGNGNHWLSIKCVGTMSNRSAIGAKIRVKAVIGGYDVWQMRQISGQSGHYGQDEMRAHFGLGDALIIDSVVIEWPGSTVQVFEELIPNQFLTVVQGSEEPCCEGPTMGNVDCEGIIDIGDVTTMIQKLFITLDEFCCDAEADLDLSHVIDIGDLTLLIQSLFITLEPLPACP